MKKISELLNKFDNYQYILGGIFSFAYQTKEKNFVFVSYSKKQKTNQKFDFDSSYEQHKSYLERRYKLQFAKIAFHRPDLQRSFGKNCIGIYSEFENDINVSKEQLLERIFNLAIESSNIKTFVRGMWETSASVDVKFNFLTRDINENLNLNIPFHFYLLTNKVIRLKINVNPRFSQPSQISKSKNSQIRIKLLDYLIVFGVTKNVIKELFEFKTTSDVKFVQDKNIYFLKKIDFSFKNKKSNLPTKMNEYSNWFHKNSKEKNAELTQKEQKREEVEITRNVPSVIISNKLYASRFRDQLTGNKLLLKDSGQQISDKNCIFEVHHIIPFASRNFLSSSKEEVQRLIHDPKNLIILDPQTHAVLHRRVRSELESYFEKMWNQVKNLIPEKSIITFNKFKLMY